MVCECLITNTSDFLDHSHISKYGFLFLYVRTQIHLKAYYKPNHPFVRLSLCVCVCASAKDDIVSCVAFLCHILRMLMHFALPTFGSLNPTVVSSNLNKFTEGNIKKNLKCLCLHLYYQTF
jgi:hypothetical protein